MVPLENISDPWITLLELRVNKLKFPLTPVLFQSRVILMLQMSIEINSNIWTTSIWYLQLYEYF